MHAWLCENPIGVEALQWKELPTPEPKAGEVRIAIRAASLNFPDLLIVQNKYQMKPPLPFVPGSEYAGIVDAVGEGVDASEGRRRRSPRSAAPAASRTHAVVDAGARDAAAGGLRLRRCRRLHPHLRHDPPRARRPRRAEGRRDAARARRRRRRRHGGDPDRQGRSARASSPRRRATRSASSAARSAPTRPSTTRPPTSATS